MPENSPLPLDTPANCNSILEALQLATNAGGLGMPVMEDATGAKLNYLKLWMRIRLLGGALQGPLSTQARVGVLLPTSVAAAVTFFSLHHIRRVPVMLNFSAGIKANASAVKITQIDCILTSKAFIAKAKLEDIVQNLSKSCTIIYLEDMKGKISKWQAIGALMRMVLGPPNAWIPRTDPQQVAAVLFTSGSEGTPKGVCLSHRNILSNIAQSRQHLHIDSSDKMFCALPVFHSFGLTVGTILPPLLGFAVYFYPSPLQYKLIPPLIRETGATIFPSADTFLRGYAAQATREDFAGLRMVVAGAERLKPHTHTLYKEKFDMDILQGYGVTETSPVASANTPEDNVPDSVGKLLPNMEAKINPVEGIEDGGELWLKGPNVMLGYMHEDAPGELQPAGEWYNTGDVVRMDGDGRLYITGRLKRFAKLGGEMVSLSVVEDIAAEASKAASSELAHAAIAIADARKGERIILLTENASLTRDDLLNAGKRLDAAELYIPKTIQHVEEIPRLGNGKINYIAAKKLVAEN